MNVQMQAGGSDCGLFAIAFATSLCYGQSPGKFHFDHSTSISCFEGGHLEMFPIGRNRQSKNKVKATKTIAVYCSCRKPELAGSEMTQCGGCKDWFNIGFCITVDKKDRSLKWFLFIDCVHHYIIVSVILSSTKLTPCMTILDPLLTTYTSLPGPLLATRTGHPGPLLATKMGPLGPFLAPATVTKLPDAKPLKLVGCYTPQGKKVLTKEIWCRRNFNTFRPLLHCHNNFVAVKTG